MMNDTQSALDSGIPAKVQKAMLTAFLNVRRANNESRTNSGGYIQSQLDYDLIATVDSNIAEVQNLIDSEILELTERVNRLQILKYI